MIWENVLKKGILNMLLRGAELGFTFIFKGEKTRLSNDSSFLVDGFLDKLGYDQNENGNI